jgi:hypothetical protein
MSEPVPALIVGDCYFDIVDKREPLSDAEKATLAENQIPFTGVGLRAMLMSGSKLYRDTPAVRRAIRLPDEPKVRKWKT